MWRVALQGLLDILWPPRTECLLCAAPLAGGEPAFVCADCWADMTFPPEASLCASCMRPVRPFGGCGDCASGQPFGQVFTLGLHEGALREAVHHLKFSGREELGPLLGRRLAGVVNKPNDCIVPVPLHRSRRVQRGYNQAALVARGLSEVLGIPVIDQGLARRRSTGHQAKLDRFSRLQNLRQAFHLTRTPAPWQGKTVLLVDDVLTTGATAAAAAKVILAGGARAVNLAVLAVSSTPVKENLQNNH